MTIRGLIGFSGVSVVENPPVHAGHIGDVGSIPWLGRSPGEENGNPLQYSCLENPMDRGPWWATVHGLSESDATLQLNTTTTTTKLDSVL